MKRYIPQESFRQLIPYLDEKKIPIVMATLERSYLNRPNHSPF